MPKEIFVVADSIADTASAGNGFLQRCAANRESMKWTGTALFALGATAISVSPDISMHIWPFSAFAAGHLLWAAAGLFMRDRAVLVMNAMYLPLDLYAILIRF